MNVQMKIWYMYSTAEAGVFVKYLWNKKGGGSHHVFLEKKTAAT